MTRRQWFLVGLITASSLSLVNARYHERRLFTQMDRTERAGLKLDSDIEVLPSPVLIQHALSDPSA